LLLPADRIMEFWRSTYATVRSFQQEGSSSKWTAQPEYHDARELALTLLDLFGYLSPEMVTQVLHDGLSLSDRHLKLSAAMSLLRLHQPVDAQEIERIASSDETRISLWRELRKLGLESIMPAQWALAKQLAASALSNWAASPFEMNLRGRLCCHHS